jgi:hypothetical protein
VPVSRKVIIAIVVIVLIGLAIWYFRGGTEAPFTDAPITEPVRPAPDLSRPAGDERPADTRPDTAATSDPVPPPPPTLQESGAEAQTAVGELSPRLVGWLTPQEPVRKGVLLVDLVAEGRVPVKNLPLSYPAERFAVEKRDGEIYLSPANYQRASELIDTITAIPPEQAVRYYRAWRPLLQEAHDELGRKQSFEQRLQRAIQQVLDTKPLTGDIRLDQPNVFYTYADPELESASDVSKLLWRLGPENTEKLQVWLREVDALL